MLIMTTPFEHAEEPPRPLSEPERLIFDTFVLEEGGSDMAKPLKAEEKILDQMLAEAPHFDLRNLSLGTRLKLISENDFEFALTFIGWKDEQEIDPTRPLLARLAVTTPVPVNPEMYSNLIIIDGASIGKHIRPEDKLTVAQHCNLRYYNVTRQLFAGPKDPRSDSEIASLLYAGKIVFEPGNGLLVERIVSPEVKFTPPITTGQLYPDGTSIF